MISTILLTCMNSQRLHYNNDANGLTVEYVYVDTDGGKVFTRNGAIVIRHALMALMIEYVLFIS